MANLNHADNTTILTNLSVQDAPLEGDCVSQTHVHAIPANEISSSKRPLHNNDEQENKRTRSWREPWFNYDTQREYSRVGYNGQNFQGYNHGRGPISGYYPNGNKSMTYHRDNANNSGQSYGYHFYGNHGWNDNSSEHYHARNYVEHPRIYPRDSIPNVGNLGYVSHRPPWTNNRPQQTWINDRSQPWSNGQQQTCTDDRRQPPWTSDRKRQPESNDGQQQPWINSGGNMANQGSPHVYNMPRNYRLQNRARPYYFPEKETNHGFKNVVGQYSFPAREESRPYSGRDREGFNLNVADYLVTGFVPSDLHQGKSDQEQKKPWVMCPAPCEGNMSLKETEMRNEKFEDEPKQVLERSFVHEQKPIFRGLGDCLRKKLLILDVNGLLADVIFPPPKEDKADINIYRRAIFKRPFLDDFLKFCFEKFDVAVWSSRTKKILDGIVDYLFGDMRCKLLFCWDQSHCTNTGVKTLENQHKELLLKELKKVWEKHETDLPYEKGYYDELNTLLLDDSPYKALRNPKHSTIFPHTYSYKDTSDNSLGVEGDLRVYLTGLVTAESVKRYVEDHPFGQQPIDETSSSWHFYLNVINGQDLTATSEIGV